MEFQISNVEELSKVAGELYNMVKNRLKDASVILALVGEMGSGKTTLTKQIAGAFKISESEITSPTFNLHVPHKEDGITIDHIDLWRIETWDEVTRIGIREMLKKNHLIVIEWADMFEKEIKALSGADVYWIKLEQSETTDEGVRKIEIEKL